MLDLNNLFAHSLARLDDKCDEIRREVGDISPYKYCGKLISAFGTIITAFLPDVKIGDLCQISNNNISLRLIAEVIAIDGKKVKLLPYGSIENISQDCRVEKLSSGFNVKIGDWILGHMIDGFGNISGSIAPNEVSQTYANTHSLPVMCLAPDPLSRPLIDKQLITGVKSIDMFTPCGYGQRVGIFAGPGMGKTTLMGMILRGADVDIIVVALVGERGREVREFIDLELDAETRKKTVLVVATSDRPPVEQVKCVYTAQTICEYFRDQGKRVLLFVDSITRFARAGREVGLSAGEPVTRGGFPPSVFLSFPKLMERAGNNAKGSITAFYTVLMEGEQLNQDPIADEIKSIIDGHIILSRKLAEQGHFPAVDVLQSLSRVGDRIISEQQLKNTRHLRLLLSKHAELEFLIRVGEYKAGNDALADEAVAKHKLINKLLTQDRQTFEEFTKVLSEVNQLN